ncbi:hypothetical protein NL676_028543 [Syzygium grande]|nr:hypothetical protein NL676_028543 [Syzygium grande]
MATWLDTRSLLLAKPRQALTSLLSRSLPFSSAPASAPRRRPPPSSLLRVAAAPPPAARSYETGSAPSSLDDPNPHWRERPPRLRLGALARRNGEAGGRSY